MSNAAVTVAAADLLWLQDQRPPPEAPPEPQPPATPTLLRLQIVERVRRAQRAGDWVSEAKQLLRFKVLLGSSYYGTEVPANCGCFDGLCCCGANPATG